MLRSCHILRSVHHPLVAIQPLTLIFLFSSIFMVLFHPAFWPLLFFSQRLFLSHWFSHRRDQSSVHFSSQLSGLVQNKNALTDYLSAFSPPSSSSFSSSSSTTCRSIFFYLSFSLFKTKKQNPKSVSWSFSSFSQLQFWRCVALASSKWLLWFCAS